MVRKKISIITPIFWGSGTGAATYYQLLLESLQKYPFDFRVFSEHYSAPYSEQINKKVNYISLLPRRSGKNKQKLLDIWKYFIQNLKYYYLLREINSEKCDLVLVHTSFYNQINLFSGVIQRLMKSHPKMSFIADVRDVLLPKKAVVQLKDYQAVISCSKNITKYLTASGLSHEKIVYLPIPQEQISLDPHLRDTILTKFKLHQQSYIFYAGMIKESKAVDLLLTVFVKEILPKYPKVKLVLSGYLKTRNSSILKLMQSPNVLYLGNCPRPEVLALIQGAELCVNLSPVESISRFALEAIALQRPVLLPPNVPEYMEHCPEFVATSRDPEVLAAQMIEIMEAQKVPNYPIEIHDPEVVAQQYYELLK